jgi:hypothetical protein
LDRVDRKAGPFAAPLRSQGKQGKQAPLSAKIANGIESERQMRRIVIRERESGDAEETL